MNATNVDGSQTQVTPKPTCPAYASVDEGARNYDGTSDRIDWDEIIATTQDDFEAGRFAYDSADYATEEEARAALKAWIHAIVERVENGSASLPASHAESR